MNQLFMRLSFPTPTNGYVVDMLVCGAEYIVECIGAEAVSMGPKTQPSQSVDVCRECQTYIAIKNRLGGGGGGSLIWVTTTGWMATLQ